MAAMLEQRDYTIIIDSSGSMAEKDVGNGQSRWQAVQEQVRGALTEVEHALEATGRAYDEAEGSARRMFAD